MMIIIETKADRRPDNLPEKALSALSKRSRFQTAEPRMIGTKIVKNKQIVLAYSEDLPDLELFANIEPQEGGNSKFIEGEDGTVERVDLDLVILAREDEIVDQSLLLPYFEDLPIFDENGEQIGTEPVTDLTGKIQAWAGKEWRY